MLAQATPQAQTLTGAAAINAVIGNTVEFRNPNGAGSAYFSPDGSLKTRGGRAQTWHVNGGNLCIVEQGERVRPGECLALVVTGDTVDLMDEGRSIGRGRILRGNPENL